MSPEETVDAFIAAIEQKDIAAAVALVAADISYENMPMQPVVGRDAVAAVLGSFLGQAGGVDWQIVSQYAVDNVVFNERVDRFEIGEGWLELPVAGIFRIDDDGLIELWRDYFDLSSYTSQLAALSAD